MPNDHAIHAALPTNAAGNIISWNSACEQLFGRSAGEAIGLGLAQLLSEPNRHDVERCWQAFPSECAALPLELVRPDGGSTHAALTLLPQYDIAGALSGSVAFFALPGDATGMGDSGAGAAGDSADGKAEAEDEDEDEGKNNDKDKGKGKESELVGSMPLRSVIDVLPGTFYMIRPDGSFALWNKKLEEVSAMSSAEVARAHALDMYDPAERRVIADKIRDVFEQGSQVFVEANYLDKYGHGTPYLLCGARIRCHGRDYLCGMGLDISERREQEDRLRLRERALHATSNGLVITRCAGRDNPIEYVNPAFERISGYSLDEAIGRDSRFMAAPGLDEVEREQLRKAIRERREINVVMRNRRKDGSIFWNDLTITPVQDGRGKVTHFIGVLNDVTAARQRTSFLEHEVNHDPLTGLANRNLMWDRLEQAIHVAQRNKSLVATVLLDLNGFKKINDTYGHEAGDTVLTAVAKRLQSAVRDSDTVARLSGDEFVLVLANQPSLRFTMRMIERLRLAMSRPVAVEGAQIELGASMGVSVFPHDGGAALDLMRSADAAMYHAKSTKKNEAHFFSSDMRSSSEAKQKLEDSLHNAIEQKQFFLLFQPKIDLRSGQIQGLEALLRWRHPEQGVLAPASFLPEAEENGAIVPIGKHVLEQVCSFLQRLKQLGPSPLPVSVNVSHREFTHRHYVDDMAEAIRKYGLSGSDLEVEMREEGLNSNQRLGIEVLSQLRELGVQRSVDAFGDGMSNLNFLRQLPLTHVKLAKVAVHQITADAHSGVMAKALIDVGHDLGSQVIAKGVETRTQMDFLRQNQCDAIQGLFFSQPLEENALHTLLVGAPT